MSLSVGQIVDRVFFRVGKGLSESEAKLYRHAVQSMIPDGLNALAQLAAERPDFALQQKRFTVSISNNIGTLASNCAIHTIPLQGSVKDASGTLPYSLQWLPSEQDLDLPRTDEFVYYTIRGGTSVGGIIIIKAGTRAVATPTSLTVTAGAFPTLANGYNINTTITDLPVQHEDDLINILVEMVLKGIPDAAQMDQ